MKPSKFRYFSPDSVDSALALLGEYGPEAKVLAGGQSLVPSMNFRLATPDVLIDINAIESLRYVARESSDTLRIGALTRHADLALNNGADPVERALRLVAPYIGHEAIRNRGTFCGSLAHADPAAEWGVISRALDARMHLRSATSVRSVEAANFFETVFTTTITPSELLIEVELPPLAPETGIGFEELTRRPGDFAIVMSFVAVCLDVEGRIANSRVALGGVADVPVRATDVEDRLVGARAKDVAALREAVRALGPLLGPGSDRPGDSEFRRSAVVAITWRALRQALRDAVGAV